MSSLTAQETKRPESEGLRGIERQGFTILFSTEDKKEGMAAFLEKRKANFRGR